MLTTATFLALVLHATSGVRGTDQYWYMGNVEQLMSGGPPLTNCVYPAPLLRGDYTLSQNYFIHHTLTLHVATWLGHLTGAYPAWIILNTTAALLSAALLAVVLARIAGPRWAALGYSFYLLMPLVFWQAANVLQESIYGLLTVAMFAGYVLAGRAWLQWLGIALLGWLAIFIHPIFFPLTVAVAAGYLWANRRALRLGKVLFALALLAVTVFLRQWQQGLFPNTLQPDLHAIMVGCIPGEGNMEWHFRTEIPPVTPDLLSKKALAALQHQLAWTRPAIFFWPLNVLVLLTLLAATLRRHEEKVRKVGLATLILLGGYALIVILHQNQFRYGLFVAGPALVGALLAAQQFCRARRAAPWIKVGAGLALAGAIAVDTTLAWYLHAKGVEEAALARQIKAATASISADAVALIETDSSGEPLLLAYALRPRPCLIVRSDVMTLAEVDRIVQMLQPTVAFAIPGSSKLTWAGPPHAGRPFAGGKYARFRMYLRPPEK